MLYKDAEKLCVRNVHTECMNMRQCVQHSAGKNGATITFQNKEATGREGGQVWITGSRVI